MVILAVHAQNLFVADHETGSIYEFTAGGVKSTFASGLDDPTGLAFDSSGDLFILTVDNLYEFINNDGTLNTNPTLYASGFDIPTDLAFDSHGDLFVANHSAETIIEITPNGMQSIFASWTLPEFFPGMLAFDRMDDLFVSSETGEIIEISPTGNQTIAASRPAVELPAGMAFDGSGNLFEADEYSDEINEFTNTNGNLSSNPRQFAFGFSPVVLAFNNSGNLFVGTQTPPIIYEYTPAGVQSTFPGGVDIPSGIAFQPISNIQAATMNGIFQLTVTMPSPYYTTILQSSSNLVSWTDVYTNVPPFTFTDSVAAKSRFYRTVLDTNFY